MYQESRIGKLMRKIATLEIEPDPYMIKSRCFALMQRYQRTLVNYKQRHVAEFFENYKCNHITDFYDNADTPADVPDYEPEESDPFAILRNDIETDSDCGEEDVGGGGRTYFIVYDPSACEGNVNEDNDHYNNVKDESSDEVPREEAVVVKQENFSCIAHTPNALTMDVDSPRDAPLIVDDLELTPDKLDFTVGPNGDKSTITFVIKNEDHTLGNALRFIIMKNPEVTYCGYSIPHPSETKLHLRIQTTSNTDAISALKKGLLDLEQMCRHIQKEFTKSVEEGNYECEIEAP
ncbi:518_t:CDS:2 [Paraglomus occultum]|uniref:DNA-directed RNA polymerases I and III subunit RPAC2 n=1 Tax=Paraglomus occultum TaxID=144539 RepID=A0A9N9CEK5_9GLOM|nr:518_t:CDS:2 [Paraglomus occultum]